MAKVWTASQVTKDEISKLEQKLNDRKQALFYAQTKHRLLSYMTTGVKNIVVTFDEPNLNSLAENYNYTIEEV